MLIAYLERLIAVSVLWALFMGNIADISNALIKGKRSVINTAYSHNGRHNLPLVGNYENRSRKRFDKHFCKNLCTVAPSAFSET